MVKSIFITGLGGQGIVTLANLIAEQASESGLKVSLFNARGMAQRGGRVTSEIRMASDPELDFGARISAGGADILMGMEVGETISSLSFLKRNGIAILLNSSFTPTEMILKKQPYPSFEQAKELFSGRTKSVYAIDEPAAPHNIFLLGVFISMVPPMINELKLFSRDTMEQAIAKKLKRGIEENLKTFQLGYINGEKLRRNA